jgi:Ca2+-binding EF-hand superfamily protein
MIKQFGAAGAAAAFLFFAPQAQAQAQPAAPAGDVVTRAQGEAMMRGLFGQLDANHDGVLDAAEVKTATDAMKAQGAPPAVLAHFDKMFAEADAGRTGKIGLDGWVKSRMAAFDKADANHDGKIDAAEQAVVRTAIENGK